MADVQQNLWTRYFDFAPMSIPPRQSQQFSIPRQMAYPASALLLMVGRVSLLGEKLDPGRSSFLTVGHRISVKEIEHASSL